MMITTSWFIEVEGRSWHRGRSTKHSRATKQTWQPLYPCQWDVPSTMNDLDFVALVRSAVLVFMLSLKAFAFVMLSKAMRAKNFGALPSRAVTFSVRAK